MMGWFRNNTAQIEAGAAVLTALVAVAALVGVKLQLDAADEIQRAQSARDAYRAHLALAVAHPALADPVDACALIGSRNGASYAAFVDHLLYSAEQMLTVDPSWESTFADELEPHRAYMCSSVASSSYDAAMEPFITRFLAEGCDEVPVCE
jgi:hypothetical protein